MVRRLILEEPPSQLAIWARWFAVFALAVAVLAVVLVRGGFVEAIPGFIVLASALLIAAIGMLLALGAFVVIWIDGNPGLGRALTALFIGLALLAYPTYLGAQSYRLPALTDITTDPVDPPRFEAVARLRPRDANPAAYPGADAAQKQRTAYPDIAPLQLDASPQETYETALDLMTKRRWRVVDARAPQAGRRDGRIEAVARTTLMGFRDDVVVRVRASGGGSRVDVRSASRYGTRDFGSNAKRVRALLEEIEENAGNQPAASR
jgi:uncharacterized protein (DUF1499 family)